MVDKALIALTDNQFKTIGHLKLAKGRTTAQISSKVGTSKGTGSMMRSLLAKGLVRYDQKSSEKPGMGRWFLTPNGYNVRNLLKD